MDPMEGYSSNTKYGRIQLKIQSMKGSFNRRIINIKIVYML